MQNNKTEDSADSVPEPVTPPGDYGIRSYDLSMYNVPYLLYIFADTMRQQYISRIELRKVDNEKVFRKTINIDSIALNYQYAGTEKHSISDRINWKHDYRLIKTLFAGVRSDNIYFYCTLQKNNDTSHLNVPVKIKYLGNQTGRMWVNIL